MGYRAIIGSGIFEGGWRQNFFPHAANQRSDWLADGWHRDFPIDWLHSVNVVICQITWMLVLKN